MAKEEHLIASGEIVELRSRRVRPTLRCLEDLGIPVPGAGSALDDLTHPVLEKGRELAPAHPANQVRIQAIEETLVYRFTHGRHRVITWLDQGTEILWLCAADLRRENEGYDLFVTRHAHEELLPGEADQRRLEDEAILTLARAIKTGASQWVADATAHPAEERRVALPGGANIRLLYAPGDGTNALWAAIPTLLANELGLTDRARGLAVAAITEALGGEAAGVDFEQRHDWPTGSLQHFEIAFFWLS